MSAVGKRIRALRAMEFIPLYVLAQEVRMSPSRLWNIEHGRTVPDAEEAERILAAIERLRKRKEGISDGGS